ncbi:MAG: ABC transporter permease [Chloroflexi bacterium]|nr:ABC transporter permease [Chloroflexota bacterium]
MNVIRRLWRIRSARVGVVLAVLLLTTAILGPMLLPLDPNAIDVRARFAGPSTAHWLGTDDLGRDTFTRLVHGSRMSLFIAALSALLGTLLGVTLGVITGFLGGWVDVAGMRVVDLFFAIPTLLVAIGIVALFGPSATTTILALGIAYTPLYARLVRGTVVSVRSRTYVDASRVLGARGVRLLRTDILPGIVPIALVQTTALLGFALVDEASLGFLGLGVQPPDASWGQMINAGRQFIFQAPWLTLIPGFAVILAVFSINLIGDGLRDALDPRASQRVGDT